MEQGEQRRAVLLAFAADSGQFLVVYMIQPLMALYASILGATPLMVGFIIASFGLVPIILAVPAGRIVDRVGTRPVLTCGSLVGAVAGAVIALSGGWPELLAGQTLLGCSQVITLVATQNYVANISPPGSSDANFGYLTSGTSLGMAIAPALAGSLVALAAARFGDQLVGYRVAFAVAGLFSLLRLTIIYMMPPNPVSEAPGGDRRTGGARSPAAATTVWELFRRRGMQIVLLSTVIHVSALAGRTSLYPLFLQGAGYGALAVGLLFTTRSLASLAVRPFLGLLVKVVRREHLFVFCMALRVLAFMAIPLSASRAFQAANMAAEGIAAGLLYPLILVLVTQTCGSGERGLGMGLRYAINRCALTATPIVVGGLAGLSGIAPAFPFGGGLLGIVFAATLVLMGLQRREAVPAAGERGDGGRRDAAGG